MTFCNLADFNLSWSVRFSTDGQYIASGGIRIFNVRMGKLVAGRGLQYGIVKALDFTPDNKGLVTGSWNERVIHWEVSLPESTHDINTAFQKIRSTAPSSTIGMREISHFEGHEVRRLSVCFCLPLSHISIISYNSGLCLLRLRISRWSLDCVWRIGQDCSSLGYPYCYIAVYPTWPWTSHVCGFQSYRELSRSRGWGGPVDCLEL